MRTYRINALDNIDSWIERDDRQELPLEVYRIDGYEEMGKFDTVEEATEYALRHTELSEEYITDYIYKEVDYE